MNEQDRSDWQKYYSQMDKQAPSDYYDALGDMGMNAPTKFNSKEIQQSLPDFLDPNKRFDIVQDYLWQNSDAYKQQQSWDSAGQRSKDLYTNQASPSNYGGAASGYYSGYSSKSSEPTDSQRTAASHAKDIMYFNSDSLSNQYQQQLENFDQADRQNRALADVELKQNSRKAANERFSANKKLQTAMRGVLGAVGNALNSSSNYSLLDMIATRTDLDNNDVWNSLMQNQNTVENAYNEALNQNVIARNNAAINAEYAKRNLEAGIAADLNNINPDLYEAPGEGGASAWSEGYYEKYKRPDNIAQLSGYIMPDNAAAQANTIQQPNKLVGDDYYSKLINGYNQRKRG